MYNSLRTQNNILVCCFFGWRGQVEINDPPWPRAWVDIEFRPQRKKGIWSSTAGFVSEGLESKRVGRRKEEEEEHKYGLLSSRLSRQRWKKRSQVMDAPKTSTRVVFLSRCAAARCSRRREDVLFSIILSLFFIFLQARSTEREREKETFWSFSSNKQEKIQMIGVH